MVMESTERHVAPHFCAQSCLVLQIQQHARQISKIMSQSSNQYLLDADYPMTVANTLKRSRTDQILESLNHCLHSQRRGQQGTLMMTHNSLANSDYESLTD
jgi:hypothetical protein